MNTTTVQWLCQCGRETAVRVWPIVPARVNGDPERGHPEEGGDIEPDECECGKPICGGACLELASEQEWDALVAHAEEVADQLRDDRRRDERL